MKKPQIIPPQILKWIHFLNKSKKFYHLQKIYDCHLSRIKNSTIFKAFNNLWESQSFRWTKNPSYISFLRKVNQERKARR